MGQFFQEHQSKLPIHEIVGDLLPENELWEDSRGELWTLCPLHEDRNPSFSINADASSKRYGLYNCFACGGGNIVQLVAKVKGISISSAEDFLLSTYLHGVILSENDEEWREQFLERLNELSDEIVVTSIKKNEYAEYEWVFPMVRHQWMYDQGLTDEAIEHFRITYVQQRGGVVFPHWWKGKLVGWQLRDLTGLKREKYKNTPNFPKKFTLYNYDNLNRCEPVIVVESPKTAAILWGRGIKNIVATFGASLSLEQMMALWGFPKVLLWFDNDEAGTKAYVAATQYLKENTEVWIIPPVELAKGDAADIPFEEVEGYISRAKHHIVLGV